MTSKKTNPDHGGFTLIELLVVIAIIGILASMVLAVNSVVKVKAKINTVRGEMAIIESALDAYQAKYHAYPPCNSGLALTNQLYYELTGVTNSAGTFITLDGAATISQAGFSEAFNTVAYNSSGTLIGVLNCTKGGGEDAAAAKNFLSGLSSKNIGYYTNYTVLSTNGILVTSIGGPDDRYLAGLSTEGLSGNPFRYVYPGVKNPAGAAGYDLWVQIVTKPGTTNLVCNWSKATQINTADP